MSKHRRSKHRSAPLSVKGISSVGFVLLYLPLVVVVMDSFWFAPEGWSLHWFTRVLSNPTILDALWRSTWIGALSALISTVLGTLAALALVRYRFPGRKLLDLVAYLPLMIPEIVLGLSLLVWFVFLKFTLGTLSILLAHVTFSVSYVVITVKARLFGFDHALEEAAFDLGATPWQTFWRVTFPLLWPGILSGALMAFTLSFDDFLITFYTAGVGSDTLPLKIYSMVKFGISPEISAVSTLMLAVTFAFVLVFSSFKRNPQ